MSSSVATDANRRFCEEDYTIYLELMSEWCNKQGVEIWAYCFMPNHIHLIAVPEKKSSLEFRGQSSGDTILNSYFSMSSGDTILNSYFSIVPDSSGDTNGIVPIRVPERVPGTQY